MRERRHKTEYSRSYILSLASESLGTSGELPTEKVEERKQPRQER